MCVGERVLRIPVSEVGRHAFPEAGGITRVLVKVVALGDWCFMFQISVGFKERGWKSAAKGCAALLSGGEYKLVTQSLRPYYCHIITFGRMFIQPLQVMNDVA